MGSTLGETKQALETRKLEGFEPNVVNESHAGDEGVTNKQLLENVLVLETILLHRLQAQTLTDATPTIGKINPFSKMAVTFEPVIGF